jgi:purine-binding chemotaxis protein CheW
VDSVSDVIILPRSQIHPAPEFSASVDTRYIEGLATVEGRMLIVTDIEQLMVSSEMALLDSPDL